MNRNNKSYGVWAATMLALAACKDTHQINAEVTAIPSAEISATVPAGPLSPKFYDFEIRGATRKLWQAVLDQNIQEMKAQLDAGADPNALRHTDGITNGFIFGEEAAAPEAFADSRNDSIIELVLRKYSDETQDGLEVLDLFVSRGLVITSEKVAYDMVEAAMDGNVTVIKWLMDHGASVDSREQRFNKGTALMQAVRWRQPEVMQLLLAAGADANAKDAEGVTPLLFFHSVQHNDEEVSQAMWEQLIEVGADVHAVSNDGRNLLHAAAGPYDSIDQIKHYLEQGVSPTKRDSGGKSPIDLLKERKAGAPAGGFLEALCDERIQLLKSYAS